MRCLLVAVLLASPAAARDVPPIWHSKAYFLPQSHTAQSITGAMALSDRTMWLGPSKPFDLQPQAMIWRDWDGIRGKETGELFRLTRDPGPLENGNTLCGDKPARHLVVYETREGLGMSVFSSKDQPTDYRDPSLCGTFYYYTD